MQLRNAQLSLAHDHKVGKDRRALFLGKVHPLDDLMPGFWGLEGVTDPHQPLNEQGGIAPPHEEVNGRVVELAHVDTLERSRPPYQSPSFSHDDAQKSPLLKRKGL